MTKPTTNTIEERAESRTPTTQSQIKRTENFIPRTQFSKTGLLAWVARSTSAATTDQDIANRISDLNTPATKP